MEFPNGEVKEFAANIIAENMFSQVDNEGFNSATLLSIVDFRKNEDAIDKNDMHVLTKSGQRRIRKTTVGWDLRISWEDGSEFWIPLSIAH